MSLHKKIMKALIGEGWVTAKHAAIITGESQKRVSSVLSASRFIHMYDIEKNLVKGEGRGRGVFFYKVNSINESGSFGKRRRIEAAYSECKTLQEIIITSRKQGIRR